MDRLPDSGNGTHSTVRGSLPVAAPNHFTSTATPPKYPTPIRYSGAVRHRTIRAKGCLANATVLAMIFKLVDAAQKSWRRLDGHKQLPKVGLGAKVQSRAGGVPLKPQTRSAALRSASASASSCS